MLVCSKIYISHYLFVIELYLKVSKNYFIILLFASFRELHITLSYILTVQNFQATDKDSGDFGNVSYSLSGGNNQ